MEIYYHPFQLDPELPRGGMERKAYYGRRFGSWERFAQMQGQNDPKLAAFAQSLQLSGDGKTVALSFAVPAEILQLIPKAQVQ